MSAMCSLILDGRLGVTYYNSGVLYELYRIQRQWWVDASVSKRMGNLRATLSARDPFNTNVARGSYNPEVNGLASSVIGTAHAWSLPSPTAGGRRASRRRIRVRGMMT